MPGWRCVQCGSDVDEGFEVCWNCGASRAGEADPAFQTEEAAPIAGPDATPAVIEPAKPTNEPTGTSSRTSGPARSLLRICPSCKVELQAIQLIDRGQQNLWTGEKRDQALRYAAADATASLWMQRIPTEGTVSAFACPSCGRIDLFAVPDDES